MKPNDKRSVGSYIGHIYRLGNSFLSKAYRDYDIGAGQYQFLIALYLEDGISHDVLTEKMFVDKATTTRAIMKLEEEGYVRRVVNEKDKRKYYIFLTEKAQQERENILKIGNEWEMRLIEPLSAEEIAKTLEILAKIEEHQAHKNRA